MTANRSQPHLSAFLCLKGWAIACLLCGWNALNLCAMWVNGWVGQYKEPKAFLILSLAGAAGAVFIFMVIFNRAFAERVTAPTRASRYHRSTFIFVGAILTIWAITFLVAAVIGTNEI